MRKKQKRFYATKLLSGFVLGTVLLTFVYYLQSVINASRLVEVAGPMLSIGAFLYWFKKGRPTIFSYGRHFTIEQHLVYVILLVMAVLSFAVKWALAPNYENVQINHDVLYHVGNIVTLSKGVPAMDPRVYGIDFFYHFQYDLIYAMAKNIFHMDAYSLYISGMPLLAAWPLGLAMLVIGDRCYSQRKHTDLENLAGRKMKFNAKYLFYLTGLLTCGVCIYPLIILSEYFPLSWLNYHIFTNINSMGLAIAAAVVFIEVITYIWSEAGEVRHYILIFMYAFFATGAKGPTGMMLVTSVFAVFFVQSVIEKKIIFTRLLYFLSGLAGFVTAYLIMVAGFGGTGGNNRAVSLDPTGTIELSRVANVFYKYIGLDPYDPTIVWIVEILIVICLIGPGVLSLLGWMVIKFGRLRKEKYIGDIFDWFCICLTIMSLAGCLVISIEGFSQGYMVLTAAPFIYYCIMRFMQRYEGQFLKILQKIAFAVGGVIVIADSVFFVMEDMKNGGYTYVTDQEKAWVCAGEMEGYKWLRDNTKPDALVASDRRTENIDVRSTFYYVSAIGERQVFLEGHSYSDVSDEKADEMIKINRSFYSSDKEVAESALEKYKINYMVVSNLTHEYYEPVTERLTLVYSNEDIRIYEFN